MPTGPYQNETPASSDSFEVVYDEPSDANGGYSSPGQNPDSFYNPPERIQQRVLNYSRDVQQFLGGAQDSTSYHSGQAAADLYVTEPWRLTDRYLYQNERPAPERRWRLNARQQYPAPPQPPLPSTLYQQPPLPPASQQQLQQSRQPHGTPPVGQQRNAMNPGMRSAGQPSFQPPVQPQPPQGQQLGPLYGVLPANQFHPTGGIARNPSGPSPSPSRVPIPPSTTTSSQSSRSRRRLPGAYPCGWAGCDRVFTRNGDASRHYEDVHLKIRYRCYHEGCSREARKDKMKEHSRKHHGGIELFVKV